MNDLKFAVRQLLRKPGFALTAVLTLGLGIGSIAVVLGIFNQVLLRPLLFGDSERLARIWESNLRQSSSTSLAHVNEIKEATGVFEDIAVAQWTRFRRQGRDYAELLEGQRVTPNLFQVLRTALALGGGFRPDHAQPGRDSVVLSSYELWQRWFDGREDIIGEVVQLNERPFEIAGVLPENFQIIGGLKANQILQPLAPSIRDLTNRNSRTFLAIGRLQEGVSFDRANAELSALGRRWAREEPRTHGDWTVQTGPLRDFYVPDETKVTLKLLFGVTGLFLLIACGNAANLSLARLHARSGEIAVRAALGANRLRLVKQFLLEACLLAGLGGVLGLALAKAGSGLFVRFIPAGLPLPANPGPDYMAFGLAALVTMSAFVVFGTWPAILAARPNLMDVLKGGAGTIASPGKKRMMGGLVAGQIALTAILLIGAGLMIQSIVRILHVELGFNPAGLMSADYQLPLERYPDGESKLAFHRETLRNISELPGVAAVALHTASFGTDFELEGQEAVLNSIYTYCSFGEWDYFRTMQIPLRGGRLFAPDDAERGVIVNEAFAQAAWPEQDAVGKQVRMGPHGDWMTIVGVAGNTRPYRHASEPKPTLYFPLHAPSTKPLPTQATCVIRGRGDPMLLAEPLRKLIHSRDPTIPVSAFRSVEESLRNVYARQRFYLNLLAAFGVVGLTLAVVGVYGLISGMVAERTREIGLRMALGATKGSICRHLLRRGVVWVGLGIVTGLAIALGASRALMSMLYELSPADPFTFFTVFLLLAVVALAACAIPTWRAMRVNPMEALRYE